MNVNELKKIILDNKKIQELIDKYNLTEEQIEDSLPIFFDIIEDEKNINKITYTSEIEIHSNGIITRKIVPTETGLKLENKNNFILRGITKMDFNVFPSSNDKTKTKDNEFVWTEDRKILLDYFKKILEKFKNNEYFQGAYIYGSFGVGKSFFTQSLANYFVSKNKTVAYININDLANYLKQLFNVGYKKAIDELKEVDFLFIDDLGSEKTTGWMIGEILFTILSHRMQERKTTFFTSNFDPKKLEKEFQKVPEVGGFKAKRIMERIDVLAIPILIGGKNWRKL